MWYDEACFYQIYTLGFCGALYAGNDNSSDSEPVNRLDKIIQWIPHLKETGINAVYFCPVFESDFHGYDTKDFGKIDHRLGTDDDFKNVVTKLHENNIKVVIDAVFNHVGRNFMQFLDVKEKRENSAYLNWFNIDLNNNNAYNDGLYYEGWEGHYELVKLNLRNPEVRGHIFEYVKSWVDKYDIDGLRLDVAYCLPQEFIRELRSFTDNLKPEFFLLGEILGGDYNTIIGDGLLHSATNYECYKGLHSSFNSMNMFEIGYSLNRQFGSEPWTLYKNRHLLCFADNHDVDRIASILSTPEHLPLIYGVIYGMPGIPCVYYGSEWGTKGQKHDGSDADLRPSFDAPETNELTKIISQYAKAHSESQALIYGSYRQVLITNKQLIFERKTDTERVLVALNADKEEFHANFDAGCGQATDLIDGSVHDFGGGSTLKPYSICYWKCEC